MQGPFVTTGDRTTVPTVRIAEQALITSEGRALDASPNEVGGILVGWWEDTANAVIRDMLPVIDNRAGRTHYERRHSPAQDILDEYRRNSDDARVGYIGEWHSHPAPQPPSSIDEAALSGVIRQARQPAVLLVLSLDPDGGVATHALVGRPRWPRRAQLVSASVERMPS